MELNKEDIRVIAYYCWKRDLTPQEMCNEINETIGENTLALRTCQKYVAQYKEGNFQKKDAPRSGRPSLDIDSLPSRWQRCIDANGEYFSHLKDNDD